MKRKKKLTKQELNAKWRKKNQAWIKNYMKNYRARAAELKRLDRKANPDKHRKWESARHKRDKAKRNAATIAWYHKHKKKLRARAKAAYDPEKNRQMHKAFFEKHRDRYLAHRRKKYSLNIERNRETLRRNYRKNPERHREYARRARAGWTEQRKQEVRDWGYRWRQKNKGRWAEYARRRRYRIKVPREILSKITAYYESVRRAKRIACHWCKRRIPKDQRTIDHIVPLSKGGPHCLSNLAPACRRCNCTKRDKMPHEFAVPR